MIKSRDVVHNHSLHRASSVGATEIHRLAVVQNHIHHRASSVGSPSQLGAYSFSILPLPGRVLQPHDNASDAPLDGLVALILERGS
jgi:hypothetical protein